MVNKRFIFFIFAGIFLIILLENVSGFAGGDGTASNPYQISTCQELQDIKTDLYANYELIKDIDCSDTINWNSGQGFKPIESDQDSF